MNDRDNETFKKFSTEQFREIELDGELKFRCRVGRIILTSTVCLMLLSCSPQVNISTWKSHPSREDNDSIVIYKKAQDIPIKSEQIGKLEATCKSWMNNCDSVSIISLAEKKIKKVGGNAFLITNYEKPKFWNNSTLLLNGDVFLVSDFSSPPDTALSLFKTKLDVFLEKYMYVGFGVGPETGISLFLPKVSYHNFQNRKNLSTYYGIEGVFGILFAQWFSVDCLYGVKKGIFTLDTSVGVWWYPEYYEIVPWFHSTLNPKIGVKFWRIWIKAGPSVYLYKYYPNEQEKSGIGNIPKIGNMYYNFEILIKI